MTRVFSSLLASALLAASSSYAQSGPVRGPALNWVRLAGAESCIAPVELAQRIEQRLGHRVFVRATDAIIVIEGRVGVDPKGGFTTVIRVTDASGVLYGTREFSVPEADCHKLDEIVSLVMAITIHHQDGASAGIALPSEITAQLDALFADEASTFEPGELQTAARPQAIPDVTAPAPVRATKPAVARGPVWVFGVEAGFGIATGLQPSATLGTSLRARASRTSLGSLSLTAALGLPQQQSFGGEGELEYWPAQLGLGACPPAWRVWSTELSLCVDARVAAVHVAATKFERNETQLELWPEVAASASARIELWEPSYLHLRLGLPLRLGRPSFAYLDRQHMQRMAFQLARFGVELELGVGVAF